MPKSDTPTLDLSEIPNMFDPDWPDGLPRVHLERPADWPAKGAAVDAVFHLGGQRWAGKAVHEGDGDLRFTEWRRLS